MAETYPFQNRPLPYAPGALEPHIDEKTISIHHDKLLGGYVDKLNLLLADHPELQNMTLEELIRTSARLPSNVGVPLSRSAGGVYNHFLYFDCMTPDHGAREDNAFFAALDKSFGSFEAFKKEFTEAAASVFGSGYAWLVYGRRGPAVITMPNQENPIAAGMYPFMCLDVWEHAYFLQYYNKRADYINAWWNLVNWKYISARYADYMTGTRRGAQQR